MRTSLTTLALVFLAANAFADDTGDEKTAKMLYKEGVAYYEKGEYDIAIRKLKAADELVQLPPFAFNIAQAYRLKGDCKQALTYYRLYLERDPLAKNKDKANELIASMLQCLKAESPPATPPSAEPTPRPTEPIAPPAPIETRPQPVATPAPAVLPRTEPPAPLPIAPPPEETTAPGRSKKIAGVVVAGAGVAAIATGIVFGVQAANEADKVTQLSLRGGTWSPALADAEASGKRDQTIATVAFVAGGAAIIGGGVLFFLGLTEHAEAPPVAVGIHARGADVVFSWQY